MKFSEKQLRQALVNEEFVPFYQPIVGHQSQNIIGCEILARWFHPEKGLLRAGSFIESIEANGLTGMLTRSLMESIFSDLKTYCRTSPFLITLNISLSLALDPVFRPFLLATNKRLKQAGLTPVFEITERENVREFPQAEDVFAELTQLDMQFAVDDFGVGYADEALLNITHSAYLKIDQHYTAFPGCSVSTDFVKSAVKLAHATGAAVIAEGVETHEQAIYLQSLGVDYLQGYHFAAPMLARIFYERISHQPAPVYS